jgi:dienelactone hydrolase
MSAVHPSTTVVLFHSMFGLRSAELSAGDRLRARGYAVVTPDLFAGAVARPGGTPTAADGFALMAAIGWAAIVRRAEAALREVPADAALVGMSMGAGVIRATWPERPDAAAVVLLHAATTVPRGVRPRTPVQVHIADGDPIAPAGHLSDFEESAMRAGADATTFTYPGAGHFFTDAELPDYDEAAAGAAWRRVEALLDTLG